MEDKKNVLITGCCGVFGAAFFLDQFKKGNTVIPTDIRDPESEEDKKGAIELFAEKYPDEKEAQEHFRQNYKIVDVVETTKEDIRSLDQQMESASGRGFDKVIHMPAILSAAAKGNPDLAWNINFHAAKKFMDIFAELSTEQGRDIAFIHNSSIARDKSGSKGEEGWAVNSSEVENVYPESQTYGDAKRRLEKNGVHLMEQHQKFSAVQAVVAGIVPGVEHNPAVNPETGSTEWLHDAIHRASKLKEGEMLDVVVPVAKEMTLPIITLDDAIEIIDAVAENKNDIKQKQNISPFDLAGMRVSPVEAMEKLGRALKAQGKELNITWEDDPSRTANINSWRRSTNSEAFYKDLGIEPKNTKFGEYVLDVLDPEIKIKDINTIMKITPSELVHGAAMYINNLAPDVTKVSI